MKLCVCSSSVVKMFVFVCTVLVRNDIILFYIIVVYSLGVS